ncbi:translocase of outer mitochondrial membrane 7 homolog [Acyrthosiphon pisum]|uniref:Mitochondrial import receptor subunit TOM7 homolog n=1 Tax=Acyrthosiphon pisum TaxID=7029 RepID=A0A8R1TE53_ACYPI|nr:translocase of outer mitochondrial membrane 7 homolog [Acyrthosiphon pisum]|eukprot:NP_001155864.1 translocase of outer mitochondrial membrane 7 homolog [Acyrthosiphon pisum]
MGLLKPGIKSRMESVTEFVKTSYHIAFIPFVIYMGFQKGPEVGGPAFGLLSLLWQ